MENNEIRNNDELNLEELEEVSGGKSANQKVKATGDVHVRAKPNREGADLGILYTGDTAPYLGERKKDERGVAWYKVSFKGKTGWVSSKYSKIA